MYQIQLRRDTAANWTTEDPTLAEGELGYETDDKYFKIGDGSTAWTSLGYIPITADGDLWVRDSQKLYLGTGKDGEIYSGSDDLYIRNVTADKDIIVSINDGSVQTTVLTVDASAPNFVWGSTVKLATGGETAPDASAGGLTLHQGAADTPILTFKSSDISHGLVSVMETDTYGLLRKVEGVGGGVILETVLDGDDSGHVPIQLAGYSRDNYDTTKTSASRGGMELYIAQHDGADTITDVVANGNLFAVRGYISSAWTSVAIIDEDGDIHTISGAAPAAFDDEDDLALVAAARHFGPGWEGKVIAEHRERLEELGILTGGMYSHRKMTALQLGAITQLVGMVEQQRARIDALEKQIA